MPERRVVSNTSPLLYLYQVQQLDLLRRLYGRITIPQAVETELGRGKELGIRVPGISAIDWIQVEQVPDRALLPAVVDLGPGEAEVIALGLVHRDSLLILDDQLGRRIARLSDLTVTGTLGILLKAKERGFLERVAPVVQELEETSMRMTEDLKRAVMAQAGELS